MEEGRFGLDIRKKFFTVVVVRHCNNLPREVAQSLEVSKARLNEALRNMIYWKLSLTIAGGWN